MRTNVLERKKAMGFTNTEIAKSALCTEGAVRAASAGGRLNTESLDSVVGFVLAMRFKELGICGMDYAEQKPEKKIGFGKEVSMENVSEVVEDLGYTPCGEDGEAFDG
jgi:hypothetical protein